MAINGLKASDLCTHADLDFLPCKSTKELPPIDEILGQDRARKAIEYAMAIEDKGYNVYALGQNGLGKRTMILRYLNRHKNDIDKVFDWCYVANFDNNRVPKVLKLPAGMGIKLRQDIESLLKKLVNAIPLAFDNELYLTRADTLKSQLEQQHQDEIAKLTDEARKESISLTVTGNGDYQFIAMNGEDLHTEESFDALSERKQIKIEKTIDKLEAKLRSVVRSLSSSEDKYIEKVKKLNDDCTKGVLTNLIEPLTKKYSIYAPISQYLRELEKDIIDKVDIFLDQSEEQAELALASLEKELPRRYKVNVLVGHNDEVSFPIIVEDNPNYHSLFGHIETATFKGTVFTDFSLIRSGSLHKANGGVLLMDAIKVLEQPYVWDGLKRALRSRQLSFTSLEKEVTLSGTVSLDPEPIPLHVKIILFGDHRTFELLQHYDAEFVELFRVTADFEHEMKRDQDAEFHYARFISSIVHDNELLHCDKKAIAKIIEHSARLSGSKNRLSLDAAHISNLLKETNFVANQANSNMIRANHVEEALKNQMSRVNSVKDKIMEGFIDGTTLLETSGTAVGQVNALSVLSTNDFMFGIPNRITATTAYGEGSIIDIERHVELGGNIHSKGVMILSAYLSSIFGRTARVPLTTHITFEQSYSGVDGDSAIMAEVCAIVSAYSQQPTRQDIAITGSMNQFGQAQPIGGVNEKIEGFFDVCKIKGITGKQGVIIPSFNVQNLMLKKEVVEAIEHGSFHIWTVEHVTEAIEILLDTPAGVTDGNYNYPIDSVFGKAQSYLNSLRR